MIRDDEKTDKSVLESVDEAVDSVATGLTASADTASADAEGLAAIAVSPATERLNLAGKKLFLLDMDGTLYRGSTVFPESEPFLRWLRDNGRDYIFLTNNSSKSYRAYIDSLARMGIASTVDDFMTSVQAMARHLLQHYPDRLIYVLGTESFRSELAEAGLNVTAERHPDVNCLVIGFDTELTFKKMEDACILLNDDIPYLATNPDWVCPTGYGYVPDCGSLMFGLEKATGKMPEVIGKPQPTMVLQAMEMKGVSPDETLVIGDRIYTDVLSGINAGVDTVLVLSGESTVETLAASEDKPTHVVAGIAELWNQLKDDIEKQ